MTNIRPPHITGNTDSERINQMIAYLRQLVEELNWALGALERAQQDRK